MPKLPLRVEQMGQLIGDCIVRRQQYNLPEQYPKEWRIFDEKGHLIAIAFVQPETIIRGLSSESNKRPKKASSSSNKSSRNRGAKKKAVRKSRSKRS